MLMYGSTKGWSPCEDRGRDADGRQRLGMRAEEIPLCGLQMEHGLD